MIRVGVGWGLLLVIAGSCAGEGANGHGASNERPAVTRGVEPTTQAERERSAEVEPERVAVGDGALEDRMHDREGIGGIVAGVMAGESDAAAAAEQRLEWRSTIPSETPADVAAPPPRAKTTASGLAYRVLTPGTGTVHAGPRDEVEVHYTGWTTDGKEFDSSIRRGRTTTFGIDKVIPGWTEGLQLMVEGEITRFWIPEELAYEGRPGHPAGMLVFDVELVD